MSSKTIRIATFNCENLFSRPRIFFSRKYRPEDLLNKVSQLHYELSLPTFDKKRIAQLQYDLRGYARVIEARGKITNHSVKGCYDWSGWVELIRQHSDDRAVKNTARVITEVDADILCLMEIETRPQLQAFHDQLLNPRFLRPSKKAGYSEIMLIDGNDSRGIDVAVMSRLEIDYLKSHVHERVDYIGKRKKLFNRDCLQTGFIMPDGSRLHILTNHLKSKRSNYHQDPDSDKRRLLQSKRIATIAKELTDQGDHVIVSGDLNATPEDPSLTPLFDRAKLYNVNLELPEHNRGTFRNSKHQLDYLLVSNSLRPHLANVKVERRGIYSKKGKSFQSVNSQRTRASDHAAVWADFKFEV